MAGLLENAGLNDIAPQYRQSAFQLFRMAGEIAIETGDKNDLFQVVTFGLIVDAPGQTAGLEWSRAIVDKWAPEDEYRRRAEECIANNLQRREGITVAGDIVSTARQVQENILAGLGIDASSQPWASLVDLALKDANPGRVLKNCEHTLVTLGPRPPTLDRLVLRSAGVKTLHCTLHKLAVTGPELDLVNEAFVSKHCDLCKDKSPRAAHWKFTHEWQDEQNRRWAEYIVDFG